jgi:glucosamine 6-phosphate synthetase-like amidotransferase/phosphosugar isomerase protein
MCGLSAVSLNPNDRELNVAQVSASLLKGIENRGRHATGAAWYRPEDDTVAVTKLAASATEVLRHREGVLPETTPAMLLHTRYATHGGVDVRNNNHPIQYGNILGIHNGVLQNHRDLLASTGATPVTDVDSEAIMALLDPAHRHPSEVLGALRGDAAIAWLDLREPEVLHMARVSGRPICVAQTAGGSLLMASTMTALEDAARECRLTLEFIKEIPDATYLRVDGGIITEYVGIPGVVKAEAGWRKQYAWTSGEGAAKAAPMPGQRALLSA